MTNFKYYKDEIEKAINDTSLYLFLEQHGYKDDANDAYKLTRWYLAEYVEPYKLIRFEKDILESIDSKFKYVCKNGQSEYIWIRKCKGYDYCCLNIVFPKIKLDCLKWDKEYKIADILANCEVID